MELIKFTLNHWNAGSGYPDCEPYLTWMSDDHIAEYFGNDTWCKENKLAVVLGLVDMSYDFCVIAPKEWVEKNCPEIIGSKFECSLDTKVNGWGTPFAPNYEDYIGFYGYNDDWDYENKCYKNPCIFHLNS